MEVIYFLSLRVCLVNNNDHLVLNSVAGISVSVDEVLPMC